MDCIIMAGGIPAEGDLLFEYARGKPKALLDIAGKPMVQWVIDAVETATSVERICLIGLNPDAGISFGKRVELIADQGTLLGNARAGIERLLSIDPSPRHFLFCSADIPLISPDMIEQFIDQCADPGIDLYYGVVSRALMESRFPYSLRSYVHLRGETLAGADVFVVHSRVSQVDHGLWEDLVGARKTPLKQARRIGFYTLIKLLFRQLDLEEAEFRVSKAIGLAGKAVRVNHAELGMDVDKPFQMEICHRELSRL